MYNSHGWPSIASFLSHKSTRAKPALHQLDALQEKLRLQGLPVRTRREAEGPFPPNRGTGPLPNLASRTQHGLSRFGPGQSGGGHPHVPALHPFSMELGFGEISPEFPVSFPETLDSHSCHGSVPSTEGLPALPHRWGEGTAKATIRLWRVSKYHASLTQPSSRSGHCSPCQPPRGASTGPSTPAPQDAGAPGAAQTRPRRSPQRDSNRRETGRAQTSVRGGADTADSVRRTTGLEVAVRRTPRPMNLTGTMLVEEAGHRRPRRAGLRMDGQIPGEQLPGVRRTE